MKVIKRNGEVVPYDFSKIEKAITSAFKAVTKEDPTSEFYNFLDDVQLTVEECFSESDTVEVEIIQDVIEHELMSFGYFEVAKAYILYRAEHENTRKFAEKKIQFINDYIESDNTANATIDDNSNVSNHNIAVLNAEIHKEDNQKVNLKILENKLKELYPDFDYKQMNKDFNTIAYLHDSSSQIGMPYCVAVSLYPFLLNGIKDLGGLSASPKNIDSFCGMFVNCVFAIAAQYKGAVATPGFFVCMDWFCRKEWGDDYVNRLDETYSCNSNRVKSIRKQIHQYFQQITYSINQPSAARGSQSVF